MLLPILHFGCFLLEAGSCHGGGAPLFPASVLVVASAMLSDQEFSREDEGLPREHNTNMDPGSPFGKDHCFSRDL